MTEFESKCYGMSEWDIRNEYMNSVTARLSGLEMVVMGIMSDCQELLAMAGDKESVRDKIRKEMNIAKFIMSEIMDARQAQEA